MAGWRQSKIGWIRKALFNYHILIERAFKVAILYSIDTPTADQAIACSFKRKMPAPWWPCYYGLRPLVPVR
jgi:hypothetical protein